LKTIPFRPGLLVLLEHNVLMRIDRMTDDGGFDFTCENGGWSAHWRDNTVFIQGDERLGDGATIASMAQPPERLTHYNDIIPWMRAHADEEILEREPRPQSTEREVIPF